MEIWSAGQLQEDEDISTGQSGVERNGIWSTLYWERQGSDVLCSVKY